MTEAARTLGASPWRAFTKVQLPLALPVIASAALLVFLFTFTSFGIILLLAWPERGTIETMIYREIRGGFLIDYETATLLALLQLVFTYVFLIGYLLVQHRSQRTVAFTSRENARRRLPWAGAAYLAALLFFLAGPIVALTVNALRVRDRWSLEGFRLLATNDVPLGSYTAFDAVFNSLRFATLTLLIALALGLLVALAANRARHRNRLLVDAYHMMPLGMSAVIIGLGYTLAYGGRLGLDLRTSFWRIVLAHALIAFPFVARILTPTVDRIGDTMRGAARTLGARAWDVVWRIELPLLRPALGVAAVYAFGVSLGEFGAALILRRPEFVTIPVAIYDGYNSARLAIPLRAQANALAFLLMLVALLSFLVLERFRPKEVGEFA
jgi:thiamine transport system permease protein